MINRCEQIKAYFRREERYEGLQLVFKEHPELKDEILNAIEETMAETGEKPIVFENNEKLNAEPYAFYIEFNDDYDKDGGNFFEILLKKLGIDKCE
ncbi:hypothetical protein [Hydrogenimonas thermophila]|uniref:Uncharacterized protein n=1 Tax=Hydrogenimonas thermophila TaxID=223786 RepID=A0A1I5TZ09_9BACT|nr:hypothetical protein [Hydrogenimonas thermophila]WOE68842.1 hypothetical protein RZR91_06930 [Hydrogenimonas thermophila]WOE71350.1 hypothetical protein RZR97_06900 [Hydrogenimonas thermophila]SFP88278.1 hypothetical protein SAMN05216234_1517 [Hydrogenimonas thermophila]